MEANKSKALQDAIRALSNALTLIDIASEAVGQGVGEGEVSLSKTNCKQARYWLIDASTELITEAEQSEKFQLHGEGGICPDCGNGWHFGPCQKKANEDVHL